MSDVQAQEVSNEDMQTGILQLAPSSLYVRTCPRPQKLCHVILPSTDFRQFYACFCGPATQPT